MEILARRLELIIILCADFKNAILLLGMQQRDKGLSL